MIYGIYNVYVVYNLMICSGHILLSDLLMLNEKLDNLEIKPPLKSPCHPLATPWRFLWIHPCWLTATCLEAVGRGLTRLLRCSISGGTTQHVWTGNGNTNQCSIVSLVGAPCVYILFEWFYFIVLTWCMFLGSPWSGHLGLFQCICFASYLYIVHECTKSN